MAGATGSTQNPTGLPLRRAMQSLLGTSPAAAAAACSSSGTGRAEAGLRLRRMTHWQQRRCSELEVQPELGRGGRRARCLQRRRCLHRRQGRWLDRWLRALPGRRLLRRCSLSHRRCRHHHHRRHRGWDIPRCRRRRCRRCRQRRLNLLLRGNASRAGTHSEQLEIVYLMRLLGYRGLQTDWRAG